MYSMPVRGHCLRLYQDLARKEPAYMQSPVFHPLKLPTKSELLGEVESMESAGQSRPGFDQDYIAIQAIH